MNSLLSYTEQIQNLPITPYLNDIVDSLKKSPSHFLILTAETAAGKSTAIPLALVKNFTFQTNGKKIVMLEPRRLAVLNIASRVSQLLGEEVGNTCGYQMHLESNISAQTRFTVLTEAILTRKLQSDPSLEDVSVVIIDEFHERSIHSDLALAFLKESMALRNDLYVIVMSATIDTQKVSAYLNAPVFTVPGKQFPVKISYAGNIKPSNAIISELKNYDDGSILVFLPGIYEINQTKAELEAAGVNADIYVLHSSIDFKEQQKVLAPPVKKSRRRVILSSAIAETSLTIPDVTVVIDSGLSRISICNSASGMETLVTRNESVFNARQRTGRAGRVAPGRCICLWNESDVRSSEIVPEIQRADLTELVLECIEWGVSSVDKISWLDIPSSSSWEQAENLLLQMNCIQCVDNNISITSLGKAVLSLGIHPRLACVAMSGVIYCQRNKCDEAETSRVIKIGIDEAAHYSQYARGSEAQLRAFKSDLSRRVARAAKNCTYDKGCESAQTQSHALLAGFPDRIAVKVQTVEKNKQMTVYQFPSGRIASLGAESQTYPEYIIAPEVDAGERIGKIYSWEPIATEDAVVWLNARSVTSIETKFSDDNAMRIEKREITSYGKIILKTKKLQSESKDYVNAVCTAVKEKGIVWLPLNNATNNLLLRVQFYIQQNEQDEIIHQKFEHLSQQVEEWLIPFILGPENGLKVTDEIVYNALNWWLEGSLITKSVPIELKLPNGKSKKIIYEKHDTKIQPVIEVIIQQVFGCMNTPKIMGVSVLFKLLSPAHRPLQITDDLENFWQNTWPEICKEMKGRYPKHNWDYRIVDKEE